VAKPKVAAAEAAGAEVPAAAAVAHEEPSRGRPGRPEHRPERRPAWRQRDGGRDEPVVGLGDHVPAFLLRPVPTKVSA
jgi:hypothetical protein